MAALEYNSFLYEAVTAFVITILIKCQSHNGFLVLLLPLVKRVIKSCCQSCNETSMIR